MTHRYLDWAIIGGVTLAYSLRSKRLSRTPISGALVFLVTGFVLGPSLLGWLQIQVTANKLRTTAAPPAGRCRQPGAARWPLAGGAKRSPGGGQRRHSLMPGWSPVPLAPAAALASRRIVIQPRSARSRRCNGQTPWMNRYPCSSIVATMISRPGTMIKTNVMALIRQQHRGTKNHEAASLLLFQPP
jgi:hypothetical protein